jgi:hypothetical protein
MFGFQMLDTAIGMVFIYLALSLLCSGINEWVARFFTSRGRHLMDWIKQFLNDPAKFAAFQNHALIKNLMQSGKLPSYIPSRTFVLALLDTIAPVDRSTGVRTLDSIRAQVTQLPDPAMKQTLLALIDDAGEDVEQVRQNIEGWFNDAMERLSGWYKRRTQWVILGLAFAVTIAMNVDTFRVVSSLYRDATIRAAVVAAAQRSAAQPDAADPQFPLTRVNQVQNELQQLNLPVGWSAAALPGADDRFGWPLKLVGWFITGFAVAQGAPFWFDMLNRLVNIRSTGEPPPTAQK